MTLVVLEGIDGAGKSTLVRSLEEALPHAVFTREPTDGASGKLLRLALVDSSITASQEVFLFMADHLHHLASLRERLEGGALVISDRWSVSCVAYQGAALFQQGAFSTLAEACRHVRLCLAPFEPTIDAVILLEIEPDSGVRRKNGGAEKYEDTQFLATVREGYVHAVEGLPVYRIDGAQSKDAVLAEALGILSNLTSKGGGRASGGAAR